MIRKFLRAPNRRRAIASRARRLSVEPMESRLLLSAAEITILNGAAEIAEGTTAAIDLGIAVQGTTGPTKTFTIVNDGEESLMVGTITLPPGFSLVEGASSEIAVRGSDTFTVRLDSFTVGPKSGIISISNNDDDENPFQFTIQGTVVTALPEITVFDGATLIANGSAVPIEFGTFVQGRTGPVRTFTVRNDGALPLTFGSISVPEGFVITDGLPGVLASGVSDSFGVRLSTAASARRAGEITVSNNDGDENPFHFAVQGTVIPFDAPDISVLDGLRSIENGTGVPIDFGTGVLGQAAVTRTFTVRNDGNATLTLAGIDVPAGFTLLGTLSASLTPRATASFTIQLDTLTLGSPAGQIRIATNDPDESPFVFPIVGSVAAPAPEIRVFREDVLELLDGVPPVSEFRPVGVGQTGGRWIYEILNDGTGTLTFGGVALPAGFIVADGLVASLAPGRSDLFSIQLDSTTVGVKAGAVTIVSNDADEHFFEILVSGEVVPAAPEIAVLTDGINLVDDAATPFQFGDGVLRAPPPSRTFIVRNDGTTSLTLGSISLPTGYTLLEGLPPALAPGAADSFTVRLAPAAVGTYAGEITIANDDADESPFSIRVTAQISQLPVPEITVFDGATPLISGSSPVIDFGAVVRRRKGITRTFTIRNDGSETLRINRVDLPVGYTLVRGPRRNLHPRGTDTFVVRLDAKQVGVKAGTIQILNDDSDESVFSIAITGTVVN